MPRLLLLVGPMWGDTGCGAPSPRPRGFWGDSMRGRGTFSALDISNHVLVGVGERLHCILRCFFPPNFFSWIWGEIDPF